MKRIIKFAMSFSFIFLLSPMTVFADDGEIIQLIESIKIQQEMIEEKLDANLDAFTTHRLLDHEHGEKVSVPCSARLEVEKDFYNDKWKGTFYTKVALTDSLLKSHNALNEADGRYPMPIEVEITSKDGEKIQMIAGYYVEVLRGNLVNSSSSGFKVLFENVSKEADKDEKIKKYGEFLNITCSFNSHTVHYH
jgi:hypothetical protein